MVCGSEAPIQPWYAWSNLVRRFLLDREPGQLTIMYKQMRYSLILPVLLVSQQVFPQTKISLRTESSDVDFVNAASTRPFKTGTTLPGTCAQGDSFLKSDASPGHNHYDCTAPGTPGTWIRCGE